MSNQKKEKKQTKEVDETKLVEKEQINPKVWYLLILPFCLIMFLVFYVSFRSDSAFSPEGEIYLTLSPVGVDEPNIYKLDVPSMELSEVFEDSPYLNLMPHHSKNAEKMVFVREYEEGVWNLVVFNKSTEEFTEVTERISFFPRNPKFSPVDDSIVYWIYEDYDAAYNEPEDSVVYLISPDGATEKISNGAYPIFSPNGRYLLLLKNDGLYTYNLLTGEENFAVDVYVDKHQELVLDEEGLAGWFNFRYNLSPNGRYFVTTNTVFSTAWILQVDSWEPFFAGSVFVEDVFVPGAMWPVFSPCGEYLAFQELNWDRDDWEVSIYGLNFLTEDMKETISYNLSEYDDNSIWVSDWIVK